MSERIYKDKGWLREKYVEEGLSQEEMAELADCGQRTISRWLIKTGVKEKREHPSGADREGGICNTPATFGTYTQHEGEGAYEFWHGGKGVGLVRVHRLLAVAEYGLDSIKGKDIHHKNGISWDNRPDNIEPLTKSEHMSRHHGGKY